MYQVMDEVLLQRDNTLHLARKHPPRREQVHRQRLSASRRGVDPTPLVLPKGSETRGRKSRDGGGVGGIRAGNLQSGGDFGRWHIARTPGPTRYGSVGRGPERGPSPLWVGANPAGVIGRDGHARRRRGRRFSARVRVKNHACHIQTPLHPRPCGPASAPDSSFVGITIKLGNYVETPPIDFR